MGNLGMFAIEICLDCLKMLLMKVAAMEYNVALKPCTRRVWANRPSHCFYILLVVTNLYHLFVTKPIY